ncbi:MAG: preprotein translocase subunit SecE [Spirochaetes bacterium]|nr:preprotein translocase subunit SecE [Spirochaetota bacterium]
MADEKKSNKAIEFIKESRKELLERSVWPSRDEVMTQTVVVIVSLVLVSAGLALVDYVISFLVRNALTGSVFSSFLLSRFGVILLLVAGAIVVAYFGIRRLRKNR